MLKYTILYNHVILLYKIVYFSIPILEAFFLVLRFSLAKFEAKPSKSSATCYHITLKPHPNLLTPLQYFLVTFMARDNTGQKKQKTKFRENTCISGHHMFMYCYAAVLRPLYRLHYYASFLSVCPSVPYWLVTQKQKTYKMRIDIDCSGVSGVSICR